MLGITILNLAGLPGAAIGLKSQSRKHTKYIVGLIICAMAHVYCYVSFMIYVIGWVRVRLVGITGFSRYLTWAFCGIALLGAIQIMRDNARKEHLEFPTAHFNPQIQSLLITEIVTFFAFFILVLYPQTIHPLWSWVTLIGYP